jgi:hypothetical protein
MKIFCGHCNENSDSKRKRRISELSEILLASVFIRIICCVSIILIEAGEVDLLSLFLIRIIRICTTLMGDINILIKYIEVNVGSYIYDGF